ncbi:MAG: CopD family protein [Rhodocyclaceae bacterium]|nr:CopD family protein [Rhodocyclaceae bacterium]
MLWVKWLHVVMVVSWFAGLFYLPRIFVNLAMLEADEEPVRDRLLLMARKLFRFMTPLAVLAVVFGLWLWFAYGFGGGWLHLKTALVVLLVAYHFWCGSLLADFSEGRNRHGHRWYRVFNELPVLVLFVVVWLVLFKPF